MKKTILSTILLVGFITASTSAHSFQQWGKLDMGKYTVGYKDTVLFKTDEQFSFYNYHGSKPFFVCIWYPAKDDATKPFMKYENYCDFKREDNYGQICDSVVDMFHKITINDGVCINIKRGAPEVKHDDIHDRLYHDIMKTTVMAKRNLPAIAQKFPCIFYHHGNRSTPYDNNVFCEYMASRGFVVVSACYELPQAVGAIPLTPDIRNQQSINDFSFMLKTAKTMPNVDAAKMVAAGHSWGAQTALRFDNIEVKKSFKEIISFHTTLEDKNMAVAKEYWPTFDYLFENKCKLSTTPSVLFAPYNLADEWDTDTLTGKETFIKTDTLYPKFLPFRKNTTTPYTFITVLHHVLHDGFITLGNLRLPYAEQYKLDDKKEIIDQQMYYEQIVLYAEQIITEALADHARSSKTASMINFKIESINLTK